MGQIEVHIPISLMWQLMDETIKDKVYKPIWVNIKGKTLVLMNVPIKINIGSIIFFRVWSNSTILNT